MLNLIGGCLESEMAQHHGAGQDGADRIGDPLAGMLRCRAVHGLEQPATGIGIDVP